MAAPPLPKVRSGTPAAVKRDRVRLPTSTIPPSLCRAIAAGPGRSAVTVPPLPKPASSPTCAGGGKHSTTTSVTSAPPIVPVALRTVHSWLGFAGCFVTRTSYRVPTSIGSANANGPLPGCRSRKANDSDTTRSVPTRPVTVPPTVNLVGSPKSSSAYGPVTATTPADRSEIGAPAAFPHMLNSRTSYGPDRPLPKMSLAAKRNSSRSSPASSTANAAAAATNVPSSA